VATFKMDLNQLKDSVSNLTLYDLKASVRKVQNGTVHPITALSIQ
jgi:epsin